MPYIPRRILKAEDEVLANTEGGPPKWRIKHMSYSDGGHLFEVRSVDGQYPTMRFRLRSKLLEWLQRHGYRM